MSRAKWTFWEKKIIVYYLLEEERLNNPQKRKKIFCGKRWRNFFI
jgi:hypothetical protein